MFDLKCIIFYILWCLYILLYHYHLLQTVRNLRKWRYIRFLFSHRSTKFNVCVQSNFLHFSGASYRNSFSFHSVFEDASRNSPFHFLTFVFFSLNFLFEWVMGRACPGHPSQPGLCAGDACSRSLGGVRDKMSCSAPTAKLV